MCKVETDLKQITNPYQSQSFYIKDLLHAKYKTIFLHDFKSINKHSL